MKAFSVFIWYKLLVFTADLENELALPVSAPWIGCCVLLWILLSRELQGGCRRADGCARPSLSLSVPSPAHSAGLEGRGELGGWLLGKFSQVFPYGCTEVCAITPSISCSAQLLLLGLWLTAPASILTLDSSSDFLFFFSSSGVLFLQWVLIMSCSFDTSERNLNAIFTFSSAKCIKCRIPKQDYQPVVTLCSPIDLYSSLCVL